MLGWRVLADTFVSLVVRVVSAQRALQSTTHSFLCPHAHYKQDLFIVNGQPQSVSSLTFVFKSTSCGVFPALNASRIRSFWHDAGDKAPIIATMERYYKVRRTSELRHLDTIRTVPAMSLWAAFRCNHRYVGVCCARSVAPQRLGITPLLAVFFVYVRACGRAGGRAQSLCKPPSLCSV